MSNVTSVVIVCALLDEGVLLTQSHWSRSEESETLQMKRVDDGAGGNKAMQVAVFCGAFRDLDLNQFIDDLSGLRWEFRDAVLILVAEEDDDGCRVMRLRAQPGQMSDAERITLLTESLENALEKLVVAKTAIEWFTMFLNSGKEPPVSVRCALGRVSTCVERTRTWLLMSKKTGK